MTAKLVLPAVLFALCSFAGPGVRAANPVADPSQPRDFSAASLAKVTPGQSTEAQVEALLGKPWRTTFADDPDEPGPVVWEYRGKDADGRYSLHIEFTSKGTATLIAKIPDNSWEAPARVAPTASSQPEAAATGRARAK